jgi:hypothetical protein
LPWNRCAHNYSDFVKPVRFAAFLPCHTHISSRPSIDLQPTSLDSIRVLRQQLETIILAESTAFEQSVNNFNLRMEALQTQLRNLKREEALLENQDMPRPAEPQRQPQKANHHHLSAGAPAFLPSGTGSVPLGQTPFFSPVVPQFKKQQPPPTRQPRPLPPSSAPYAKPSSVHVPAGGAVTAPKTATPSVHDVPPPRAVRAVSGELAPRRSSAQSQGAPSSFAPPSLAASRRRPQSTAAALAGGSTEVRSTREECGGLHTAEVDESQSGESLHGDGGAAMVAADPMASLSMLFPQPGSHAASVSRITSTDAVNANAETVATMAPADHTSDAGGGDSNSPKRLDGEDRAHGGGRQTGPPAHTGDAPPNKGLMPVARSEASPRAAPAQQEPVSSCVDSATGSEDHRHPIAPRKRGVAACTNGSPHDTSTDFDDILAGRYCRDSNGSSSPLASSVEAIEASSRVAFNDEEFPSLPAAATSGSLASNPWAKGSQLVAQLSANAVDVSVAAPGARAGALAGVEKVEITAGLRPANVALPGDIERRQQLRRRGFQLWDSDGKGRREVNVVEGLELFESVLGPEEQALIVKSIESWEQAVRILNSFCYLMKRWRSGISCCWDLQLGGNERYAPSLATPSPYLFRFCAKFCTSNESIVLFILQHVCPPPFPAGSREQTSRSHVLGSSPLDARQRQNYHAVWRVLQLRPRF